MNERIRELMRGAIADALMQNDRDGDMDKMYIPLLFAENFAELLIKECATVCEEIAGMAEATNTGEMARKTRATAISCSNFIKNRFGVK